MSALRRLAFSLIGLGWGLSLAAHAEQRLPDHSAVPGGVAWVELAIDQAEPPQAFFNQRRVLVAPNPDTASSSPWIALVGIPLSTKPGQHQIRVEKQQFSFKVTPKQYREQRLTIKNKRQVNPNTLDMKRINREKKQMLGALANWSEPPQTVTRFQRPAPGPYSSPFGLRRFFNDQPRKPHSGLDIAAPKGTPIVAPAPGVVIDSGDYFFNGRNLILDHGRGLLTMYSHMEQIDVEPGQQVATGDRLGTVGNSGRVTGPHLHWSVSLNNTRVDPMLFLAPEAR